MIACFAAPSFHEASDPPCVVCAWAIPVSGRPDTTGSKAIPEISARRLILDDGKSELIFNLQRYARTLRAAHSAFLDKRLGGRYRPKGKYRAEYPLDCWCASSFGYRRRFGKSRLCAASGHCAFPEKQRAGHEPNRENGGAEPSKQPLNSFCRQLEGAHVAAPAELPDSALQGNYRASENSISFCAGTETTLGTPHGVDVRNTPNGVWKTCVITVLMTAAI